MNDTTSILLTSGPRQRVRLRGVPLALTIALGGILFASPSQSEPPAAWQEIKSRHFIILHTGDPAFAEKVATQAEQYYEAITTDIGFTRFTGFWLWDHRARILIYPSATLFRTESKAPEWASGRASASLHEIAGFRSDDESFLKTVLPHEMTHLILAEFIGPDRLPHWMAEGVAQWEQEGRGQVAGFPFGADTIPLETLITMDIRNESRPALARLYYAQCASLVGFLITEYGGARFARLCRALRDGKPSPEALAYAYPTVATSLTSLEAAWSKAVRHPPSSQR